MKVFQKIKLNGDSSMHTTDPYAKWYTRSAEKYSEKEKIDSGEHMIKVVIHKKGVIISSEEFAGKFAAQHYINEALLYLDSGETIVIEYK